MRLFERLLSGYFMTPGGENLLQEATKIDKIIAGVDHQIVGNDTHLSGPLRVTLLAAMLAAPLIGEFAAFAEQHPTIRLELLTTFGMANLYTREVDLALRISSDPPADLVGRRLLSVVRACYVAEDSKLAKKLRWIGWSNSSDASQWHAEAGYADTPVGAIIDDPFATLEAVRAGMGIAILPCFMADGKTA